MLYEARLLPDSRGLKDNLQLDALQGLIEEFFFLGGGGVM